MRKSEAGLTRTTKFPERAHLRSIGSPHRRASDVPQTLLQRSIRALALVILATPPTIAVAQIGVDALPTGAQLVAGQAVISQLNNQMRISQSTDQAIINWNTFNIGSAARVDFQMPASTSAVLNRVISNDPSSLLGTLTGNGRVWLINPAGIMVGPGATIDVAGFIGSTLNIRDEDFLAGRLTFSGGGNGALTNFGSITTPEGGNVYLVGASVENHGLISTPGGEVLLAAGQTVELADTATPGVKVAISGSEGSVVNVGQVLAEAGRVGLAGVLVRNSGSINASSVVREGGRVFLRATKSVISDAGSVIDASGTRGGEIRLIGDERAQVDGALIARGRAGPGGFVETSGKQGFEINQAPDVGAGGEWLIDPNNISIRAAERAKNVANGSGFTSTGDDAVLTTELLEAALNAGTNVSITTTADDGTEAGDINVDDPIIKSAGGDATLTLNAQNNINLSQAIVATQGKLNVALAHAGTAALRNSVALNGGKLTSNGRIVLAGATLDGVELTTTGSGGKTTLVTEGQTRLANGSIWNNLGTVEFADTGSVLLDQGTSFHNQSGGTVKLQGNIEKAIASNGGTTLNSGTLTKTASGLFVLERFSNAGSGVVNLQDGTLRLAGAGTHGGSFNLNASGGAQAVLQFAPGDGETVTLSGAQFGQQTHGANSGTRVEFDGDAGGTIALDTDVALGSASLRGGMLTGSGRLSAAELDWSGGTIHGGTGDPAWTVTDLTLGGSVTLDRRTLNLVENGNAASLGATLQMRNGAQLNNAGTFIIGGGSRLGADADGSTALAAINNSGTLIADGNPEAPATNYIGSRLDSDNAVQFNNGGSVVVRNSPLQLNGPGRHGGSFALVATVSGAQAGLTFNAGNGGRIDLEAGATISQSGVTGSETLVRFGSATNANGVVNIDAELALSRAALEGGVLRGAGKLSVDELEWSGGIIRGDGADPAWQIGRVDLKTVGEVDRRAIELGAEGGSTASAGAGLHIRSGSETSSAGNHALGAIRNDGDVRITAGTLQATEINGHGSIEIAAGAKLESAALGAEGATEMRGAGTADIGVLTVPDGSLLAVDGIALTVTGNAVVEGSLAAQGDASVTANGPLSGDGSLYLLGGSITLNGQSSMDTVSISDGVLDGRGGLDIGELAWEGGTIRGISTDPAWRIENLRLSGLATLDGRTLELVENGQSTIDGGVLWMSGGARINNAGTMMLANGSFLGFPVLGQGDSEINNSGTIYSITDSEQRATNAIGGVWDGDTSTSRFNNLQQGTVVVRDSTLELGPGKHQGQLKLEATRPGEARLTLFHRGGLIELSSGTSISESAANGGTTHVQFGDPLDASDTASGTTLINTDLDLGNVTLAGGVLAGSAALKAEHLTWSGGTIRGTSDDAAWEVTDLDTVGSLTLDGRTLNLLAGGTGSAASSSSLEIRSAGVLNSAGNTALAEVDNAGAINVTGGALTVMGMTQNTGSLTVSGAGSYVANGEMFSSGSVQLDGGNLVLNSESGLNSIAINSGSVRGTGHLWVFSSFSQSGGEIDMNGTVSLHQQTGDLTIGRISAGELILSAANGAISQTAPLQATVLETVSTAGTVLQNADNQVGTFAAHNSGRGDIVLVSISKPAQLILDGIINTAADGGNVSIDNTGAIVSIEQIGAAGGVSIVAHSPMTIDAPIAAGGDVTLQASASSAGNDNLTINSSVSSTGGSLQLSAGEQLTVTSNGSLSVTSGSTIALTSVNGEVAVDNPASISGATPVITQPSSGGSAPPTSTPPDPTPTHEPTPTAGPGQEAGNTTVLAATTTLVSTNSQNTDRAAKAASGNPTENIVPNSPASSAGATLAGSGGEQTIGGTAGNFGDAGSTGANSASQTAAANADSGNEQSPAPSGETSASNASSSTASNRSDDGDGDNKDDTQAASDEPEPKQQTASKSARKSLPVCN